MLRANKILILGEVGWECDQITAASGSGNTCKTTIKKPITLIRLLFGCEVEHWYVWLNVRMILQKY